MKKNLSVQNTKNYHNLSRFVFMLCLYVTLFGFTSCGDGNEEVTLPHENVVVETELKAVDLGLSVKWANMNVGASKNTDTGDYFAWGETQPKAEYDWSNYTWCEGTSITLTKYCTNESYGTIDNKTTLEAADDAATVNWGNPWRMPTVKELEELIEKCTWTWSLSRGCGYIVKGPNGRSIFLPAAGSRAYSIRSELSSSGYYWSSSLDNSVYTARGNSVKFDSSGYNVWTYFREAGFSVRPVMELLK